MYDKHQNTICPVLPGGVFYTHLNDAIIFFPLGEDEFGQRFEKRNGPGATGPGYYPRN